MFSVFHKKLHCIFKLETVAMLQITDIIITVHKKIRKEQEDDYGTVLELG
jgi:nucleoside 2-deoxyribosyltransferase